MEGKTCYFCSEKLYKELCGNFNNDEKKIKNELKTDKIFVVDVTSSYEDEDLHFIPFIRLRNKSDIEKTIAPYKTSESSNEKTDKPKYNVRYVQQKGEEKNPAFPYIANFLKEIINTNKYEEYDVNSKECNPKEISDIDMEFSVPLKNEEELQAMAEMDAPLFILGERGTGKTSIVRKIFGWKKNKGLFKSEGNEDEKEKDKGIIEVQCGNIPKELEDDRFYGHVKGAYTGATKDTHGFIELANNKILFLDEIQDLSKEMQRKLIEVLRTGKYYKIGGEQEETSKFKLVVATNRSVAEILEKLDFDFFDRISTFQFKVPSLRDFKEESDLKIIWSICWDRYFREHEHLYKDKKQIIPEVLDFELVKEALKTSDLRGNYRDIEKLIAFIDMSYYNKDSNKPIVASPSEKVIKNACEKWKKKCDERDKIELNRNEMLKSPDTLITEWVESEYREDNHGETKSFDDIIKSKIYTLKGTEGFSEKLKKRLISIIKKNATNKEISEWLEIDQKTVKKYVK